MNWKRTLAWVASALALSSLSAPLTRAEQAPAKPAEVAKPAEMKLKVGDVAPDFTLLAYDGQKVTPVSLHDFKGKKNVALAFYAFAFTGG